MKQFIVSLLLISSSTISFSQSKFSKHEIAINGFRNPSIGVEYRYKVVSVHAGYYPTNFKPGVTTSFVRTGLSFWFLPVGKQENPSSFYVSLSVATGLNKDYSDQNAGMAEGGFRWMIYKGINLRLGLTALAAKGHDVKINPTPGISYSFFFN
ncbi:MAG: hypothetical protein V4717_20250 [Bacteroidota bacterium]